MPGCDQGARPAASSATAAPTAPAGSSGASPAARTSRVPTITPSAPACAAIRAGQAAPEHLDWQTANPYVAERERELVRAAFLPLGARVLDSAARRGRP